MERENISTPGRRWQLRALASAGVLLPPFLLALFLWQSFADTMTEAGLRAERKVKLLANHVDSVFQTYSLTLDLVDEHIAGLDDEGIRRSGTLATFLRTQTDDAQIPSSLFVVDSSGRILLGSKPTLMGLDASQRDYFTGPIAKPGLHIGERIVAQNTERPLITLSRARRQPGTAAGVIVASLRTQSFENLFAAMAGEDCDGMVATLYRSDGRQLVRWPVRDAPVDLSPSVPGLMPAIAKGVAAGSYRVTSIADGTERLYAYRRVGRHDAYVTYGLDIPGVLRPWRRMAVVGGGLALCGSAALWGLAVIIMRRERLAAEAKTRLAQLVDELTREAGAALEARATALDVAERANRGKAHFLAAASHDLRQPIQGLRLFLDVLAMRLTDSGDRRVCDHAVAALEGAEELLKALLDVSTLDAGMVVAQPQVIELGPLLAALVREAAPVAAARGLELRVVEPSCMVRSDPMLLRRIVRNLLGNALRYTDSGRILIGCRRRGGLVCIQVWDTGIGIPADKLDVVFEDFVQLGNAERDRTKGLGLGLSVVRRMADLLGHALMVRSAPGQGSLFSVVVPLAERLPPVSVPAERMLSA